MTLVTEFNFFWTHNFSYFRETVILKFCFKTVISRFLSIRISFRGYSLKSLIFKLR